MKVLPEITNPPDQEQEPKHRPAAGVGRYFYQTFRSCLRWEFGFSCPFCLLHEGDLMHGGTEGWRVMTVEHFRPQSRSGKELVNDYHNCLLCCVRCNCSRGDRPVLSESGALLNPRNTVWAEHFFLDKDFKVRAHSEDNPDAERTIELYDLNDPQKVVRRRLRSEALQSAWKLLRRTLWLGSRLDPRAEGFLTDVGELGEQYEEALRSLALWVAVPCDAPEKCGCKTEPLSLPEWLDKQCEEFPRSKAGV